MEEYKIKYKLRLNSPSLFTLRDLISRDEYLGDNGFCDEDNILHVELYLKHNTNPLNYVNSNINEILLDDEQILSSECFQI